MKIRKEESLTRAIYNEIRDSVIFSVFFQIILWIPRLILRVMKNLF
ncbi:hypothetical protein DFO73_101144 [Cytobacillus oceanisediminis]|uniref:Uncharacterized protein n=1 Tax=Cytobacillus oceanisediminis TaxID=665099 RepID=A0A2V3A584_9BACI|nr:hypothetical protein DFO73_101144 [Cytobacillus oceanisediminis]